MPESAMAAGITVVGYLAVVLRTWIHTRGMVQLERARGSFRRDVVRELPQGSRFIDRADQLTIEVGKPAGHRGDARGLGK